MSPSFYMGSQEFTLEWILQLEQWFEVKTEQDEDAIYIHPKKETYTAAEMLAAITLIGDARPDECDEDNGWIRLWWD